MRTALFASRLYLLARSPIIFVVVVLDTRIYVTIIIFPNDIHVQSARFIINVKEPNSGYITTINIINLKIWHRESYRDLILSIQLCRSEQ